jgi:GTP cyclohydrolase I
MNKGHKPGSGLPTWVGSAIEEATRQLEAENAVKLLVSFVGENPKRAGLVETPARFVKALQEMTSGYTIDPRQYLKTFEEEGPQQYNEMVVQRDIPFVSLCEHHLLQFSGVAHVAYLPAGKIIGLSKMVRIVHAFARRLQVQERLTTQVTDLLMDSILLPNGAACVIEASHSCIACRGVNTPGSVTVTASLRGAFKTDPATRAEFYRMIGRQA